MLRGTAGAVSPSPARPPIVVARPPSTAPRDAGHAGIGAVFLTCADRPCLRLFPARPCQTGTDGLHGVGHYPPWSACAILGPPRRVSRPFRINGVEIVPLIEMFNTFNNANNINPLSTPALFNFDGFLRTGVGDPRQVQLALKVTF